MDQTFVPNPDNLAFVEDLFIRYLEDPASVDPAWHHFLEGLKAEDGTGPAALRPNPRPRSIFDPWHPPPAAGVGAGAADLAEAARLGQVWRLVNAFRVRGHVNAQVDPLNRDPSQDHPELEPSFYGFTPQDLDRDVPSGGFYGVPPTLKLRDLVAKLRETYSRTIGVEFMNINDQTVKHWLAERMETCLNHRQQTREEHIHILRRLLQSEGLEQFIHTKYPGTKRFSLEGGEGFVPLLDQILEDSSTGDVREVVIGMAHRGRLNVLVNIMGKPFSQLFEEFEDVDPRATLGAGDVKYHLGYSSNRQMRSGKELHLSLSFNPSHLEAVDSVVEGRVRAKQDRHRDWGHRTIMPVLIHGDAAFSGQGLVAECLNLADLSGYRTGGTIHIVINNHIGFTTPPKSARSTHYSTDVARMMQIPIFHVNGEDPEALSHVAQVAVEFRARFRKDVVIDMHCYRKYGHNEMDEPSFTQPLVYDLINSHSSPVQSMIRKLIQAGEVTQQDVDKMAAEQRELMEEALTQARNKEGVRARRLPPSMGGLWSRYKSGPDRDCPEVETSVDVDTLRFVTHRLTTYPDGFTPHPKAKRLLQRRQQMIDEGKDIDWGMAEVLAYGTLVIAGSPVRMSGQDCRRGTFSHRHAVLADIKTGAEYVGLEHISPEQAPCHIYDSSLSEAGVLGFEWGYSLDYPEALVIWEAQFGDFANGAQVIIDQFIISSEDKWRRCNGLVMLLPHGYEGQGPEHSSARLERYLQSCAEDNIQVAVPTTPANFFHLLRRQVVRPIRKPLVVMSPKSLLRHPRAVSTLDEFTTGGFLKVIDDPGVSDPNTVTRLVLCAGKLWYDLTEVRERTRNTNDALVRIELLYPLPEADIQAVMARYPNLKEVVWAQEEPWQMGAWHYIWTHTQSLFAGYSLRCVSRPESASPATGSHKAHLIEAALLMVELFGEGAREAAQEFYKAEL